MSVKQEIKTTSNQTQQAPLSRYELAKKFWFEEEKKNYLYGTSIDTSLDCILEEEFFIDVLLEICQLKQELNFIEREIVENQTNEELKKRLINCKKELGRNMGKIQQWFDEVLFPDENIVWSSESEESNHHY